MLVIWTAISTSKVPGLDLRTKNGVGTEVHSPVSGTIESIVRDGTPGGQANQIDIREDFNGLLFTFVHTKAKKGLNIGDRVEAADLIGNTDRTGIQKGSHLHAAVRLGKKGDGAIFLDPAGVEPFLDCVRAEKKNK